MHDIHALMMQPGECVLCGKARVWEGEGVGRRGCGKGGDGDLRSAVSAGSETRAEQGETCAEQGETCAEHGETRAEHGETRA